MNSSNNDTVKDMKFQVWTHLDGKCVFHGEFAIERNAISLMEKLSNEGKYAFIKETFF